MKRPALRAKNNGRAVTGDIESPSRAEPIPRSQPAQDSRRTNHFNRVLHFLHFFIFHILRRLAQKPFL